MDYALQPNDKHFYLPFNNYQEPNFVGRYVYVSTKACRSSHLPFTDECSNFFEILLLQTKNISDEYLLSTVQNSTSAIFQP